MAHLAVALLGPFQATLDGRPVEGLNSDRLRALLAYLGVESGREHSREQVASLLWPERTDQEALSALRNALSKLRGALGDRRSPEDGQATSPFLLITRSSVQLNQASDYWLDVAELKELKGRERAAFEDLPALTRAVSLYRGPFLHGLSVADSSAFDEWMLFKGEEYRRDVLSLLEQLTSLHIARGGNAEAARWARRQLELEPYHEAAHRQLMAALALGGERPAALAHYEACRRLLAEELGCEPDDETQALDAQIRDGTLALSASPSLGVSAPPPLPIAAEASPPPRFVARELELARLRALLDQALTGQGGVALIAGEAGSGKTVLLDEFARQAGAAHRDLIAVRGRCNAHGGTGDPYLPFREILRTLAGDVEGRRAGGTLSAEQARRAWEALPAVGAALVEHGPDLIDTFVPGEGLLRRAEAFCSPAGAASWQAKLREIVRRAGEGKAAGPAPQPDLLGQVTQVLHGVSQGRPLLLAIDDLQWADGGTAALLFHMGRRLAGSRILLACAYRPEAIHEAPDFPDLRGLGDLGGLRGLGPLLQELAREWGDILVDLDRADGRAFVDAYLDSEPNRLTASFRQALYAHTEGSPLFTVELLRSFERAGALVQDEAGQWIEAPGLDWDHVPARVEAVIAGHLASLPDEDRKLLGAASVQGEQFIAEVAARVLGWDEEAAVQHLSGPLRRRHRLVEADRLERLAPLERGQASSGQRPLASSGQRLSHYRFRHWLVQRSAYGSLDAVERTRLHEVTGQALEAIYAPKLGTPGIEAPIPGALQPEGPRMLSVAPELARHYEAAGMPLQAARALYDAGRQAMRLSAFREALSHFEHGLSLLADEPPSPERTELERLLQIARLVPQAPLRGLGSPQFAGNLAEATNAGAGEAQGRLRLQMLQADANLLSAHGPFGEALALAGQMLDLAEQRGDEAFVAGAHLRFGLLNHLMGRPQEAESHFEQAIARMTPERRADSRAALGLDVATVTPTLSALDQWFLGHPEVALARSTQALADALEQGSLNGQVFASALGCTTLFLLRSDAATLQERAELAYRLSLEGGIAWLQAYTKVFLGWLAVLRGDDAGIEQMRSAIAAWQATGMAIGTDGLLAVLGDGCLSAARRCRAAGDLVASTGRLAIGLAAIEPFLGPDVACGQTYQAELWRVRGELLLERDGQTAAGEALASLQRAVQIGAEQGAPGWELRAAMSLVRLRQRQGEACAAELVKARRRLAAVYGRFTEGFAFPDLQDAAALIGEK